MNFYQSFLFVLHDIYNKIIAKILLSWLPYITNNMGAGDSVSGLIYHICVPCFQSIYSIMAKLLTFSEGHPNLYILLII